MISALVASTNRRWARVGGLSVVSSLPPTAPALFPLPLLAERPNKPRNAADAASATAAVVEVCLCGTEYQSTPRSPIAFNWFNDCLALLFSLDSKHGQNNPHMRRLKTGPPAVIVDHVVKLENGVVFLFLSIVCQFVEGMLARPHVAFY